MNYETPDHATHTAIDGVRISAYVYHSFPETGTYMVKLYFPQLKIWINSFTAQPSPKYPDKGLWVLPPQKQTGKGKFWYYFETGKKNENWHSIQDLIKQSVQSYQAKGNLLNS